MTKFKCKRCGYCCTLKVKLSLLELLRIIALGYEKKDFVEKNVKGRNCIKLINDKCYFLTKKNNKPFCKIYRYRPRMCREYPGLETGACKATNKKSLFWELIIYKNNIIHCWITVSRSWIYFIYPLL